MTMQLVVEYDCLAKIEGQRLFRCERGRDGGFEFWAGDLNWKEVKPPYDPKFLAAVAKILGAEEMLTLVDGIKSKAD